MDHYGDWRAGSSAEFPNLLNGAGLSRRTRPACAAGAAGAGAGEGVGIWRHHAVASANNGGWTPANVETSAE